MPEFPHLPEAGFDRHLGTEYLEHSDGQARVRVAVTDKVLQPFGLVHGGVYSALAETLASRATTLAVWGEGKIAVGQSNLASFLRPITAGHVNAEGRARHRGRSSWIWEVEITDDEGRLCALVRVTLAIRPAPAGMQPPPTLPK